MFRDGTVKPYLICHRHPLCGGCHVRCVMPYVAAAYRHVIYVPAFKYPAFKLWLREASDALVKWNRAWLLVSSGNLMGCIFRLVVIKCQRVFRCLPLRIKSCCSSRNECKVYNPGLILIAGAIVCCSVRAFVPAGKGISFTHKVICRKFFPHIVVHCDILHFPGCACASAVIIILFEMYCIGVWYPVCKEPYIT